MQVKVGVKMESGRKGGGVWVVDGGSEEGRKWRRREVEEGGRGRCKAGVVCRLPVFTCVMRCVCGGPGMR